MQRSTADSVTHALHRNWPPAAKNVFLICPGAGWSNVFAWMGLALVLVSLYWLHLVYTDTHSDAIHTYESSFISWLSVLAIFLGGAGLSASPCSCSLFFAAFCDSNRARCKLWANVTHFTGKWWAKKWRLNNVSSAYLFVPLLMKVTQEDVCFLCYNNCGKKYDY